jgi:hypothetical protein
MINNLNIYLIWLLAYIAFTIFSIFRLIKKSTSLKQFITYQLSCLGIFLCFYLPQYGGSIGLWIFFIGVPILIIYELVKFVRDDIKSKK